jgi:hypothetical protein
MRRGATCLGAAIAFSRERESGSSLSSLAPPTPTPTPTSDATFRVRVRGASPGNARQAAGYPNKRPRVALQGVGSADEHEGVEIQVIIISTDQKLPPEDIWVMY